MASVFWKTVATGILIAGATAAAAQETEVKIKIDELTCREMLKMGAQEREFTMVFMHGLISGAQNEMVFDAPVLTAASDAVLNACIDNPDATLLGTFKDARQ